LQGSSWQKPDVKFSIETFEDADLEGLPHFEWILPNPHVPTEVATFERKNVNAASRKRSLPIPPVVIQRKVQKNPWTGFRVPGAEAKILQGIVTSSFAGDIIQVNENEALIQHLLEQLARASLPVLERWNIRQ